MFCGIWFHYYLNFFFMQLYRAVRARISIIQSIYKSISYLFQGICAPISFTSSCSRNYQPLFIGLLSWILTAVWQDTLSLLFCVSLVSNKPSFSANFLQTIQLKNIDKVLFSSMFLFTLDLLNAPLKYLLHIYVLDLDIIT